MNVLAFLDKQIQEADSLSADAYYVWQAEQLREVRIIHAELIEALQAIANMSTSRSSIEAKDMAEVARAALAKAAA